MAFSSPDQLLPAHPEAQNNPNLLGLAIERAKLTNTNATLEPGDLIARANCRRKIDGINDLLRSMSNNNIDVYLLISALFRDLDFLSSCIPGVKLSDDSEYKMAASLRDYVAEEDKPWRESYLYRYQLDQYYDRKLLMEELKKQVEELIRYNERLIDQITNPNVPKENNTATSRPPLADADASTESVSEFETEEKPPTDSATPPAEPVAPEPASLSEQISTEPSTPPEPAQVEEERVEVSNPPTLAEILSIDEITDSAIMAVYDHVEQMNERILAEQRSERRLNDSDSGKSGYDFHDSDLPAADTVQFISRRLIDERNGSFQIEGRLSENWGKPYPQWMAERIEESLRRSFTSGSPEEHTATIKAVNRYLENHHDDVRSIIEAEMPYRGEEWINDMTKRRSEWPADIRSIIEEEIQNHSQEWIEAMTGNRRDWPPEKRKRIGGKYAQAMSMDFTFPDAEYQEYAEIFDGIFQVATTTHLENEVPQPLMSGVPQRLMSGVPQRLNELIPDPWLSSELAWIMQIAAKSSSDLLARMHEFTRIYLRNYQFLAKDNRPDVSRQLFNYTVSKLFDAHQDIDLKEVFRYNWAAGLQYT